MAPLSTKHGQPSTYSPRTLESSRNRLGNFLSSITSLGSPLGPARTRSAVGLPDSPLKARIYRRGGEESPTEELGRDVLGMALGSAREGYARAGRDGRTGVVDSAVEIVARKEGEEGRMNILDLPDDLILLILEHLPKSAQQLHTVSLVCRRFFEYSQSPTLWADLYHSTPGYRLTDDAIRYGIASDTPPAIAASWYHLDRSSSAPFLTLPSTPSRLTPRRTISTSPSQSRPSSRQIPIHYPTLYRARHTLSHTIRNPSPSYRTHTESLKEHSDSVYCIKAVGRWLFTGSRDRSIRIWRLGVHDERGQVGETTLVKAIADAHEGSVLCMGVELEDGKGTIVTGSSDRTVKIWSFAVAEDGGEPVVELESTLTGHTNGVLDVILTESYVVSCSKDTTIRIYDRQSLNLAHTILAHTQSVNALAVSPNGTAFASASGDGTWMIWDIATGKELRRVGHGTGPGLACIAWEAGYIAIGDNARNVLVYNDDTGKLLRVCKGHTDLVRTVALDPEEGLVVSGSYDGSVRIWDLHTGIRIRKLPSSEPTLIFDIHLSPNKLLVARQDETIDIISLVTGLPYLDIMLEEGK